MRGGLAYRMNRLGFPEKASVWKGGNYWKKMQKLQWKNNLPYRYKLENWEYMCKGFEMFTKKNNQTSSSDALC